MTSNSQTIYIYALYDGTDNRPHPNWKTYEGVWFRYIGRAHTPEKRVADHVSDSRKKNRTRKEKWIRSVLRKGTAPKFLILETTTLAAWREREKAWIAKFPKGQLTNGTIGGDGLIGASKAIHARIGAKVTVALQGNNYRTGIGWITNGSVNQAWSKSETLPEGFRRGLTHGAPFERKVVLRSREITNGLESKMLAADDPLPEGWFFGKKGKTSPMPEEQRRAIGKSNTGKKRPWAVATSVLAHDRIRGSHWINNSVKQKFSNKDEFLEPGWIYGKVSLPKKPPKPKKVQPKKRKYNGQTKGQRAFHKRMRGMIADTRWVTNGVDRKRTHKDLPLSEGWVLVRGTSKWITNGTKNKLLLQDHPLPEGWRFGMTKPSRTRRLQNG